jgi:AcrR family transcriptional regulator
MARPARFTADEFLDAAVRRIAAKGPAAATVSAIAADLRAPSGSFYHRFRSREALVAAAWLRSVERFQEGFLARLARGGGLEAALHTPRWARARPEEARLLLLHRREELVTGPFPAELRVRAEAAIRQVDDGLRAFARARLGGVTAAAVRRVWFAVVDVPYAAVRRHLAAGEAPPPLADELIRAAYRATMGDDA